LIQTKRNKPNAPGISQPGAFRLGCGFRSIGFEAWQTFKPTARFGAFDQDASASLLCDKPPSINFAVSGRSALPVDFAKPIERKSTVLNVCCRTENDLIGHDVAPYSGLTSLDCKVRHGTPTLLGENELDYFRIFS
jgi:hypothetical protein